MAPQVSSFLPPYPPVTTTISPTDLLATPESLAHDRALALWREHIFPLPSLLTPPSYLHSPPEDDFEFALHYHLYGIWSSTLVAKWDWEQRKTAEFRWVGSIVSRQEVESVIRKIVLRRQGLDGDVRVWWWIRDEALRGGQSGMGVQVGPASGQGQGQGGYGNGGYGGAYRGNAGNRAGPNPSTRPRKDDNRPKRGRPKKEQENDGWGKVKIRKLSNQQDAKEEQREVKEQRQVEQAAPTQPASPASATQTAPAPTMLFLRGANQEDNEADAGQRQDGSGEDQEMEG